MNRDRALLLQVQFWVSTSLMTSVGLIGGICLEQAIAPVIASAYTGRLNVTLTAEPRETFETLLRRAESVARAAAQRNFDRDILITDVSIIVSGEYQSRVAPILTLEATRNQWKSRPDARRWATYYRSAKALLRLDSPSTATGSAPSALPRTPNQPQVPLTPPAGAPATGSPLPPTPPAESSPAAPPTGDGQPANTPILPDRILTPAGIGK